MLSKDAITDNHCAVRLNLEFLIFCKNIITIMIIALINTCGPLFRGIKLLTLVQDSSIEQKPEAVSVCKSTQFISHHQEKCRKTNPVAVFSDHLPLLQ